MENKEKTENAKLIIISDIQSKTKSIIPFGLHLAKQLESEVDLIHIVDVRRHQGVPSRYADSQTLSAGPKLTFDQIVEREVNEVSKALDKTLSKEASRLNFPLKINKRVKEGRLDEEIRIARENSDHCILLINEEPDGNIFSSKKEILEFIENEDTPTLLIPPKMSFREFKDIVLITDFSNNFGKNSFVKTAFFLRKLNSQIVAVDVARPKRVSEMELKGNKWRLSIENLIFKNIKTLVLIGISHSDALQKYIRETQPDLIIYSYRKPGFLKGLFHNSLLKKLLQKEEYPIVYMP